MSCIEGLGLSDEQKVALFDTGPQVLVSAGAGSGKTRLLVAYFVRALVDEGIPPERLVAVTFTRKAAAELVTRIRSALEECGRADLARALDSATVGTIHGLCRRLIDENALEADVDPVFRVLEAEATALIKEEASKRAWERVAEQADEAILEVLASRRDSLRKEIVPLYDRLRGMGWECPQVEAQAPPARQGAEEGLRTAIRDAQSAGCAVSKPGVALQADLERLQDCLQWLDAPLSLQERGADLAVTQRFFPSRKTRTMEPSFEPVRTALTRYRQTLADVRLESLVEAMNRLLREFHADYTSYKRERSLLDFADLELRARALVAQKPGEVSRCVLPGSRVLIDEFQDTNEVQCGILEGLGAERLLMVGDERQSIYRFRGADVAVFVERERRLQAGVAGGTAGRLHRLDVNYRSRAEILEFINRLFRHETFFGDRFVALRVPPDYQAKPLAGAEPAVELLVAERVPEYCGDAPPVAMQQAEAEVVAARIRRAIDDEGRLQRDIVLLLPAQTHVDLYQQALRARGVDVYVVRGKGYYSQEEVTDVTSLLRLLVNPHDDLALVAVLRSPLVGLSDDGLYLLGREGRCSRSSLWEVLREGRTGALAHEDRRALSAFAERLQASRSRVGRSGLARLIDETTSACGYDLCVLASAEGRRRFANIRKLMRLADEFEALEGPDLAGFVDLLRSMGDLSDQEGSAPTLAEGEDVVRVMTVHQAKGLEFSMVVLAGLGSDVYFGAPSEFVVGGDGQMGVFLKGSRHKTHEPYDLCWCPAVEIVGTERAKAYEEDARLLYVAMTRAEDRLVLVGARPQGDALESCRIGRIAAGLGLGALPEEGGSVVVPGLDAVVRAVPMTAADEAARHEASDVAIPAVSAQACPQFLGVEPRAAGLRQVSFSALAAYGRCPRQFYLERVLGLGAPAEPGAPGVPPGAGEAPGDDDDGSVLDVGSVLDDDEQRSGRDVGLLVHAMLERLPLKPGRPAEAELREEAARWLDEAGVRLAPADLDRAVTLALAFWDSPVAAERTAPTALREAPFFFAQGEVMVSGIMDLVSRPAGLWRIIDYKTNALKGRAASEVASNYELQAVTYCLAALKAGAPAVRMDLIFLEQPGAPVTREYSPEHVAMLEGQLEDALEGLRRGRFPLRSGDQCGSCSVADLCEGMACG